MKTNSYLTDLKKQQGLLAEYLRSIDVEASDEDLLNELIQKLPDYTGSHVVYEHDSSGNVISAELHNFSEIPDYAFYNCATLRTITFVDCPLIRIGKYAFYGCTNFNGFTIPESVTIVDDYALYGCTRWRANVPTSVVTIGKYAYSQSLITRVPSIPNVTSIGQGAFKQCGSLVEFVLPEDHEVTLGSEIFSRANLSYINLPDWVTSIPGSTFYCCYPLALTEADLPPNLTSLGNEAFQATNCSIHNIPEGITSIGRDAFCGTKLSGTVTVPSTVVSMSSGIWISTSPKTIHFKCAIPKGFNFGDNTNTCKVTNLLFEKDITPSSVLNGFPNVRKIWIRKGVLKQYVSSLTSTSYLWSKLSTLATIYVEFNEDEIPAEWHANWNKRSASSTINVEYGVTTCPW